ncbi:hypothetical protein BHE74_00037912 [Ensete ventricosum]|nr:hypothetical protein BHE74_00037912 [Ensete ventricosum]
MDLNVLCKKPRKPSEKSAPAVGPESTQPEVEVIHAETLAQRPIGSSVPDQAMKEQRADRRKADDKLLKLMRNESLKAERPGKSIADYKQSVRFGWGLRWIGQVSYEYGYRVALARFQARYPDLEVDNRPFTKQPEDRQDALRLESEKLVGPTFPYFHYRHLRRADGRSSELGQPISLLAGVLV